MAPTIVLAQGRPVLAAGSPGGATIITTILQILVNHLDFDMTLPEAIVAARLAQLNGTFTGAERDILATSEAAALEARGHQISETATLGNVTGIAFLPDERLQAAAEPERLSGGSAMVVRPSKDQ